MTLRAIAVATKADAVAIGARVDASHGLPRCERVAGRLVALGDPRVVALCRCVDASAPLPSCPLTTRGEARPLEIVADRSWVYPVDEAKPETLAALTAAERDAIVTVADGEAKPVADSDAKPVAGDAKR